MTLESRRKKLERWVTVPAGRLGTVIFHDSALGDGTEHWRVIAVDVFTLFRRASLERVFLALTPNGEHSRCVVQVRASKGDGDRRIRVVITAELEDECAGVG